MVYEHIWGQMRGRTGKRLETIPEVTARSKASNLPSIPHLDPHELAQIYNMKHGF